MGTVAEATRLAGGRVVGVIPQALVDKELADHACDELHIVQNMHERKAMMAERSDAFVALPGGIGTFEELFEVWTWRQLGYHGKPLGLLNVAGYYDGLLGFLQTSVKSGFMGATGRWSCCKRRRLRQRCCATWCWQVAPTNRPPHCVQ